MKFSTLIAGVAFCSPAALAAPSPLAPAPNDLTTLGVDRKGLFCLKDTNLANALAGVCQSGNVAHVKPGDASSVTLVKGRMRLVLPAGSNLSPWGENSAKAEKVAKSFRDMLARLKVCREIPIPYPGRDLVLDIPQASLRDIMQKSDPSDPRSICFGAPSTTVMANTDFVKSFIKASD